MPYNKKKQKCKQSDGDSGAYVLSYTDKKGKKHNNCHTSKKKMQGQIAAIEAEADMTDEEVLEELMTILKKPLEESIIRKYVSTLLREDLTGSDKADIKRMIKKEIEGPTNRREVDKAFKKNFNAELKKALGVSFFGTPGKINKFVIDEIQKEVMKNLDSKASKDVIIFVCKEVIKKLYRELSFSSPQIIDRINPKV
jgi:hypothetical protein